MWRLQRHSSIILLDQKPGMILKHIMLAIWVEAMLRVPAALLAILKEVISLSFLQWLAPRVTNCGFNKKIFVFATKNKLTIKTHITHLFAEKNDHQIETPLCKDREYALFKVSTVITLRQRENKRILHFRATILFFSQISLIPKPPLK